MQNGGSFTLQHVCNLLIGEHIIKSKAKSAVVGGGIGNVEQVNVTKQKKRQRPLNSEPVKRKDKGTKCDYCNKPDILRMIVGSFIRRKDLKRVQNSPKKAANTSKRAMAKLRQANPMMSLRT